MRGFNPMKMGYRTGPGGLLFLLKLFLAFPYQIFCRRAPCHGERDGEKYGGKTGPNGAIGGQTGETGGERGREKREAKKRGGDI